jgi:hypothetical protein
VVALAAFTSLSLTEYINKYYYYYFFAGVAHYVCLHCGQHDLTAEANRLHCYKEHRAWFVGLPRGESSYKVDKTKAATYFKVAKSV